MFYASHLSPLDNGAVIVVRCRKTSITSEEWNHKDATIKRAEWIRCSVANVQINGVIYKLCFFCFV